MNDLLLSRHICKECDCIPKISPDVELESWESIFAVVVPIVERRSDQVTSALRDVDRVTIPDSIREGPELY